MVSQPQLPRFPHSILPHELLTQLIQFRFLLLRLTDYFQHLAILKKSTVNILVQIFLWAVLSIPVHKYLGRQLLSYAVSVHLT